PITCDNPRRGIWGGPPPGVGASQQTRPALDLAFAPRGAVTLSDMLRQSVPELSLDAPTTTAQALEAAAAGAAAAAGTAGAAAAAATGSGGGCGSCAVGPQAPGSAAFAALFALIGIGGLLAMRRRS
ncbi:MAG: MYXO-CTERM sorting domain-containing protein, partial [Deltaproteobacteria bacterium]|nr:MYXO-CTERM sorting domain-containing protein [Deltaproteobacteria bacterium]